MPEALRILITVDADRASDGVMIPHAYGTQIEFLQRAGNTVCLFGVNDRTSFQGILRNIRELRQTIDDFKPDLIVAYYGSMVAAISRTAAGRIPLVVTFRGSDLLGTSNLGWKWRVRDWLGRCLSLWAAHGAKMIVANGNGLLLSLPLRLHSKAYNLPNGINTEKFSPIPLVEARARLGWCMEKKVILFNAGVGSGQVVKNRPLAEATVSLLRQQFPSAQLETISTLSREDVSLRMSASDALLVTSLHEGSPDLVKEAMACNLPVVSVTCGDVPERLKGVSLSFVRPYEVRALAEALMVVLRTGGRSDGRKHLFAQGLDISIVTERVLEVYRQALEGIAAG